MSENEIVKKFESFDSLHDEFSKMLTDVSGHTTASYEAIHSYLVEELSGIGEAVDDGYSDGDFIMDRKVGNSVPIGVVVEKNLPGTVTAVQKALSRIGADYCIHLDLYPAHIIVAKGGMIGIYVENEDSDSVLSAIR